jgi:hypothetical protein
VSARPANTARPTITASHAVFLDGDVAQQERPAQRRWPAKRDLVGTPDHLQELLGHDEPARRHQDLLQVLAVDRPHDHALEGEAQQAAHHDGRSTAGPTARG